MGNSGNVDALRRAGGRGLAQIRALRAEMGYLRTAEGSVLLSQGDTRLLCAATIERSVPPWMQAQGIPGGWITAEYAMLPRATHQRTPREVYRPKARSQEIRRLIGRSLRAAFRLELLPPVTCIVDCDVIQADGGTRTAAVTCGYLALLQALHPLSIEGDLPASALLPAVAAISVGVVSGQPLVDLDYAEDSQAAADVNVVMNAAGAFIEVQGTAERGPLPKALFLELLAQAEGAIRTLIEFQRQTLEDCGITLTDGVWLG